MNRRRFLKYASAAGLGVAGVAMIGYELQRPLQTPPTGITPTQPITSLQSATPSRLNARFSYRTNQRTLKHIVPHSAEEIQFINETEQLPSSLPVGYEWSVDDRIVATGRDYSSTLSETRTIGVPHTVRLTANADLLTSSQEEKIDVDPQDMLECPRTPLETRIKGMNYLVGQPMSGEWSQPPSEKEIAENLLIIREHLGCNGLRIHGGLNDTILKCLSIAQGQDFEMIFLNPLYLEDRDVSIQEHAQRVEDLAEQIALLGVDDSVVLGIGNSLSIYSGGILPGSTYRERKNQIDQVYMANKAHHDGLLNAHLESILKGARAHFRGKITYTAGSWEGVDYAHLGLDAVSIHGYYRADIGEEKFVRRIQNRRVSGAPLIVGETGSATFAGCGEWGSEAMTHYDKQPYSQEEQARWLARNLDLISRARADAVFVYVFMERKTIDETSFGITKYERNAVGRRKVAYYAYKNYYLAT